MSLEKILLIRHAQSLEDVNPDIHNLADDSSVGLTELGISQATELLVRLKDDTAASKRVKAHVSPSFRAQATWSILRQAFPGLLGTDTEPRIRNLDWGDITAENRAAIEAERYAAGVLNYAFPGGDNTPEYAKAIDGFVHEALRGLSSVSFPECVVVLTHGFALRLIARSILRIGDEEFRPLANPPNCYCSEIRYDAGSESFGLLAPLPVTGRRCR